MIFRLSWQDPNSPHHIRPYPNLQAKKKHPFSHIRIISIRKKIPAVFFGWWNRPKKPPSWLWFFHVEICRWCHCLQDLQVLEFQSNWPRKTSSLGKIRENAGRGWFLSGCSHQFNGSRRSPGQGENLRFWESSLHGEVPKIRKPFAFLDTETPWHLPASSAMSLRSSRLISCDCRLTTSW